MSTTPRYKGIIFNSATVRNLQGELLEKVREYNIKTAVVTRKTRTEVKKDLKQRGISVDVIIGGKDLNTRFTDYGKPLGDPMVVAAAKMFMETSEVACWGDYSGDRTACEAAGIKYCHKGSGIMENLAPNICPKPQDTGFPGTGIPTIGIMGAVCGDIIGSAYEFHPTDRYDFDPFVSRTHVTDDSVATMAVASWLIGDRSRESLIRSFTGICNRHPNAGYGSGFKKWLRSKEHQPYGGRTNGAMMRASACGWAARTLEEALDLGKRSAEVSHNSEEGIQGAQAVSAAIFLARNGQSKDRIKEYVETTFGYDLDMTVEEHKALRSKDYSCHVSGAQAFRCWLEADSYEDAIRKAVILRTDADTVADIAGAIAAATPGMEIPKEWSEKCYEMLDDELKGICRKFYSSIE